MRGNRKCFIVTEADNGFIVRVKDHGLSMLKEPYENSLLVFSSVEGLLMWIKQFTGQDKNAST